MSKISDLLAFGDFPYGLHIMIQWVVFIDCNRKTHVNAYLQPYRHALTLKCKCVSITFPEILKLGDHVN